jgi:two-component system, NarL family, invasion response regulator UvrY
VRILLVDDHATIRAALGHLLRATLGASVAEAADGPAAMTAIDAAAPDIVLLDLGLPEPGGLALLPALAARGLRVVVLTMHAEPFYARRAFEAGAAGFVTKSAGAAELVQAIERVAAGGRYVERKVAQDLAAQRVEAGEKVMVLTDRDLEMLRLLGSGQTVRGIAATLGISVKTAANAMTLLKKKLGVASTVELMRLAIELPAAGRG